MTATSASLAVFSEKSIDGMTWETGVTFTATTVAAVEPETLSSGIYRYMRIKATIRGGGTATFQVDAYTKNYS